MKHIIISYCLTMNEDGEYWGILIVIPKFFAYFFFTNYKLISTYCLVGFVAEDRMKVLGILESCQSEPRETLKENTPALGKL